MHSTATAMKVSTSNLAKTDTWNPSKGREEKQTEGVDAHRTCCHLQHRRCGVCTSAVDRFMTWQPGYVNSVSWRNFYSGISYTPEIRHPLCVLISDSAVGVAPISLYTKFKNGCVHAAMIESDLLSNSRQPVSLPAEPQQRHIQTHDLKRFTASLCPTATESGWSALQTDDAL